MHNDHYREPNHSDNWQDSSYDDDFEPEPMGTVGIIVTILSVMVPVLILAGIIYARFDNGQPSVNSTAELLALAHNNNAKNAIIQSYVLSRPEDEVITELLPHADAGDMYAQTLVCFMYSEALGTTKDMSKAHHYCELSAAQGHSAAQMNLGTYYKNGQGVEQDLSKAIAWYTLAADQGREGAQITLADMYYGGNGTDVDRRKAYDLYVAAAEQGNVHAMRMIAVYYQALEFEGADIEQARTWLLASAKRGHIDAQYFYGQSYWVGNTATIPEIDREVALKWISKAAKRGHPAAQYTYGIALEVGFGIEADEALSVEWKTRSAVNGYIDAQEWLAERRFATQDQPGHLKDATLLTLSNALRGDRHAQLQLKHLHMGKGYVESYQEVVAWYQWKAEQGDVQAMRDLGELYRGAIGVERSTENAMEWYNKAAMAGTLEDKRIYASILARGEPDYPAKPEDAYLLYWDLMQDGHARSHYDIARSYLNGWWGLPEDHKAALMWLSVAELASKPTDAEAPFLEAVLDVDLQRAQAGLTGEDQDTIRQLARRCVESAYAACEYKPI